MHHWRDTVLVCSLADSKAAQTLAGKTFQLAGLPHTVQHVDRSPLCHPGCVVVIAHAPRFTDEALHSVLTVALVPDICQSVQGVRCLSYTKAGSPAKMVYVVPNPADPSIGGIPAGGRRIQVRVPGPAGGMFTIKLSHEVSGCPPASVLGKHSA